MQYTKFGFAQNQEYEGLFGRPRKFKYELDIRYHGIVV